MLSSSSPFYIKPRLNMELMQWAWHFYKNSTAAHVKRSAPHLNNILQLSRRLIDNMRTEIGDHFDMETKGCFMMCKQQKTLIGTGIAFPYGSATSKAKLLESEDQIEIGCTVLDMVANIAWLKDKKYDQYQAECNQFVELCHNANLVAKVIIQVGFLNDEETIAATKMVAQSGAEFVKTATGTGPVGRPNFHDAQVMLHTLSELKTSCRLKVSGVVEPRVINAYAFIRMGAALIGTRSAVEIVEALPEVQRVLFP